jgi:hypothetical protein
MHLKLFLFPGHTATAPKSSNTVVSTVKNTPSDLGLLPSQYLPGAVVGDDDEEDGWGWDTNNISGIRGEKSWHWQAVTGNDAVPAGADAILCNVHGVICPKGICREYARISRERGREKATRGGKDVFRFFPSSALHGSFNSTSLY